MSANKHRDNYSDNPMKPDQTALHAELARQTEEFIAKGGKVQHVAHDCFGEDPLAKRQIQINRKKVKK